ncbi:MAG: RHS repeat protein [Deltaproteobacteria bacterium]|nr:MAG: RHS repeat protein [Deltaproteobacteria bacterium]
MLKKFPLPCVTVLIIFSILAPVSAGDQTVFGPQNLTISLWRFHFSGYQFNADGPSDGTLILTKNNPEKKIQGGFLLFNQRFIPIGNFLTGSEFVFETDIQLKAGNRLFVILWGAPGSSISIEVKKTVAVPAPEVTISANPASIKQGDSSTLTWSTDYADTCIMEPGIGNVDPNGSVLVSPQQSTVYTLTATGPGGTNSALVTVVVVSLEDLGYGFSLDEQQGGGGLVGETIRILNGNTAEFRQDLGFSSPNRLGLSFAATYNSRSKINGLLGYGWTHTYGVSLHTNFIMGDERYLKILDQTGRAVFFKEESVGFFKGQFYEHSYIASDAIGYVWYRLDGSRYGFAKSGAIMWLEDESGNRLDLEYDAQNRLQRIVDIASGRELTFAYNSTGLLESISGPITSAVPDGVWVSYGYDQNQNLVQVIYADGSGVAYGYADPADVHNLTKKKNAAGHLLNTWTYDDQDRCIENYSVNGKGVSINYLNENQAEVTDAYGVMRIYTIDEFGDRKRISSMTGSGGAAYNDSYIVRWAYDNRMNLTEVETTAGIIHLYLDHDAHGNPGTLILAAGTSQQRVIYLTYHPELNVPLTRSEVSVLGSGDKVTFWDYDNDYNAVPNEDPTGLISRIIEQGFTRDAGGAVIPYEYVTTVTYNPKGQVLTIDGPLAGTDDTIYFTYDDDSGDLLSITRPLIGSIVFSDYNTAGWVGRITDVNGQSELFTHDAKGRITAIIHQADNSTRTLSYNLAGLVEVSTDEDGVSRYFDYDGVSGRLIRKSDGEGNYITYQYDVQGNRIEMSKYDVNDNRTSRRRWSYQQPDIAGKLWKEIKADNTFKEFGYDFEGNVAAVTDFEGHTTTYEYDPLNRLVKVIQPGSAFTSYDYDNHGNLISVTDAENHETTFAYDDMARLVASSSPDSGTATYVYDVAGNPTAKTDAMGITVQYDYDVLNRLTAVRFPDPGQNIIYTYDDGINGIGHRTGITDPSGNIDFEYDNRGRLVGKTSMVNGYIYPVTRRFTPGGRLNAFTYPSGRIIDYTRYANGKLQKATTNHNSDSIPLVDNLSYNPFGTPNGLETGSGGIISNVSSSDCDCLEVINPGQPMEQVYTYDANRNLTSIRGTYAPWYNQDFSYDALNRLITAKGVYGTIDYTYDKVGNRLTRAVNGRTESLTYYTDTNKLARFTGPDAQIEYTYDPNGNVTGIGNKTLIYSQNNRLIRVEENGNVLGKYTYNSLGQRVIKEVNGQETIFHYDFSGNLIAESSADGIFAREYLYVDQARLAMVDVASDTMYYYLNNYLGTPVMMTDNQGVIVWEAHYKPFGEVSINPNSEVVNNFRFLGQYYDQETGFHYNWFRYYDPRTGRYLTPDPIGFDGGINLYVYASLNPISFFDFLGLKDWAIRRKGFSLSAIIVGFSHQTIEFVSECDGYNMRTIKTYRVVGLGLTVGLEATAWGNWGGEKDQSKGYWGGTNVYREEPKPITGISVSGPSGGLIKGGTLASATLDFTSFADVYSVTTEKRFGLSIFNFEGQRYKLIRIRTENCCE